MSHVGEEGAVDPSVGEDETGDLATLGRWGGNSRDMAAVVVVVAAVVVADVGVIEGAAAAGKRAEESLNWKIWMTRWTNT